MKIQPTCDDANLILRLYDLNQNAPRFYENFAANLARAIPSPAEAVSRSAASSDH